MTGKLRFWLIGAALLVLAAAVSGCSSRTAAVMTGSSWPGITATEDRIYLAFGAQVYALDAAGQRIWAFPEEPARSQAFYAAPVVSDDLVVVGDYTASLFGLDPITGQQRWTFQTSRSRFVGGAVIGEELVYAGSVDGVVHALDRETGQEVATFSAQRDIWSAPLLDGDTLYVASLDRHVYALDASTLSLKWQYPAEGEELVPEMGAIAGTPTLYDGVLYFGSFNNTIYAIDIETRSARWTYTASNWVWSSPVKDEVTGLLLGGDLDGHVFALDPDSGDLKWEYDVGGPVVGAPAFDEIDGQHVAYVTTGTTSSPNLYTLDVETGTPAAVSYSQEAVFTTRFLFFATGTDSRVIPLYAPPIVFDDLLLIGAHTGDYPLYALERETLRERWSFTPAGS
jgi:outer membrane protein assembly factor BamB